MDSKGVTSKRTVTLRRVFRKISQAIARKSLIPSFLRIWLYKQVGINFTNATTVFIGEDVYFDDIRPDLISIGSWVRITSGARIFTHFFDTNFVPEHNHPFRFYDGQVSIGDYVFIGSNVIIAKPCNIGQFAVIRANSVLTQDVPPFAIMIGSPARQIGTRPIPSEGKSLQN